jgi:hypothetical protein
MRHVKVESLILFFLLLPSVALPAKDLSDYPLRVEILWDHQEVFNVTPGTPMPTFIHRVNGLGNVKDGRTLHAFDFESQCSAAIGSAPLNQPYFAKWKKPQLELEILMPDIGHEGKYTPCRMDTAVRKGVYVPSSQGIIEVSQEDYKAGKIPTSAAAASPGPKPAATISKLSVSSNPAGADIDVDGDFMGTTPSVLQLPPGEHTISLHKTGYKVWQRKMKVVEGKITLNPDLEADSPK